MHDDFVGNRRGVFEYVLGGCQDTKLLNIRYPMLCIGMNAQVIKLHLLRAKKAGRLGLNQLVSIHKVQ